MKFPGLISGCTIDWFSKWPKDALIEVSSHFLGPYEVVCTPEVKLGLIDMVSYVHDDVGEVCLEYFERFRRRTYVTPKTYISFLESFKELYKKKLDQIGVLAHRMNTGLSKLVEAQASVDILRTELVEKEKEMAVATDKAEAVCF